MKKAVSLMLALSMTLALLTGCGSKQDGQDGTDTNGDGQEMVSTIDGKNTVPAAEQKPIVIYSGMKPHTLDPLDFQYGTESTIGDLIYSPLLFAYDDGEDGVRPNIITEYERLTDAEGYLFTIREGVTFSNGEALTADDVAFTLEQYATNAYTATDYEKIDHCEVVDDTHVRVILSEPFNALLKLLPDVYVLAKDYYTEVGGSGYSENPVFSGPYVIADRDDATGNMTFAKNPDYYGDGGYVDTIKYRVITDLSTALVAFETGEINTISCSGNTYKALMNNDKVDFLVNPSPIFGQLFFNTSVEPMNDPIFRKAVAYALDNEAFAIAANGTYGYTLVDSCWSDTWGEAPVQVESYEYNTEKAKELLAEGGYETPYDLGTLTCTSRWADLCVVIQQCLADAGINVKLESVDGSAWIMGLITGDYKLTYMLENDFSADAAVGFKTFLHSNAIGGTNMTRYNNPEMDKLLDLATATDDPAEKRETLGKIITLLNDDLPAYTVYNVNRGLAVTKGLTFNADEITPDDHEYFYRWFWAE